MIGFGGRSWSEKKRTQEAQVPQCCSRKMSHGSKETERRWHPTHQKEAHGDEEKKKRPTQTLREQDFLGPRVFQVLEKGKEKKKGRYALDSFSSSTTDIRLNPLPSPFILAPSKYPWRLQKFPDLVLDLTFRNEGSKDWAAGRS